MAANLTAPRPDLVFLRRRLKPGETATVAPTTRTTSLRLGAPEARTEPVRPVLDIPVLSGRVELTEEAPVVRLNRRQSAIGSLTVDGAAGFGFTAAGVSGVQHVHSSPNADVPVYGNRPLIGFDKNQLVVGLRHFQALKRVIVWADSGRLTVRMFDGMEVIVESQDGVNGVYIHRVGGVLELRLESVHSKDFVKEFSVVL